VTYAEETCTRNLHQTQHRLGSVQVSGTRALFYSSVKCTGAPKYPYKDILVHRCTYRWIKQCRVAETFKHSWPSKPHSFGHVHRCKFLVQVFLACITPTTVVISNSIF